MLERSVTWNTKSLRPQSWRRVLRTVRWTTLLCGLTCEPSSLDAGVDAWISSWAGSPVSRGLWRGSGKGRTTRGTSGPTRSGSPSRSMSSGSSSRTLVDLFGTVISSSSDPTLRAQVTGLRRSSSRLRTLVRAIAGNASSSSRDATAWPTATAEDAESSQARRPTGITLTKAARQWSTTTAADGSRQSANYARGNSTLRGAALRDDVLNWPTPQANELPNKNANQTNMPPARGRAAEAWQTPSSPRNTSRRQQGSGDREPLLGQQAELWQTPGAAHGGHASRGKDRIDEPLLAGQAGRRAGAHPPGGPPGAAGGRGAPRPPPRGGGGGAAGGRPPPARDWKGESAESWRTREEGDPIPTLADQVFSLPDQSMAHGERSSPGRRMTRRRCLRCRKRTWGGWDASGRIPVRVCWRCRLVMRSCRKPLRRRLNPRFVEWLMGWERCWTSLAPLVCGSPETASYRSRQRSRLRYLLAGLGGRSEL